MIISNNSSLDVEMSQPSVKYSKQDNKVAETRETTEVHDVPNPAKNSPRQLDLIEVEINPAKLDQKVKIRA